MRKTIDCEFKGKKYEIVTDDGGTTARVQVKGKNGWHMQKMPDSSTTVAKILQLIADGSDKVALITVNETASASELPYFAPLPEGASLDGACPDDPWWVPTWSKAKEAAPVHLHAALGLGGLSSDMKIAYFKLPGNKPWIPIDVVYEK